MKAILLLAAVLAFIASGAQANKCVTRCTGSGNQASCSTRC
jgi:hypothetical protein